MHASDETARSALATLELFHSALNVGTARALLLDGNDPAYPLVSRKGRQAFPCFERSVIVDERRVEVFW